MKFAWGTAALAASVLFSSPVQAATVKVPEGTEFRVRIEDKLSSKTSAEGDRFTITLVEDVKLPDGTTLRAGYRGVGEIAHLQKSGRVGKKGELNIRIDYLKVGDERIKLRASKGAEGSGNTGNLVVAIAFGGVFGLLVKGKSAEMEKGVQITAYSDGDTELATPFPTPPAEA